MPLFLVERYVMEADAAGLAERLRRATKGTDVAWLGSIAVPGEDAWLCLFEAPDEAGVVAANRRAGAGLDRVVRASFLC